MDNVNTLFKIGKDYKEINQSSNIIENYERGR